MGWIKSTYGFAQRGMIFKINRQDAINENVRDLLKHVQDTGSADLLEATLRKIIAAARPELSECVIEWMDFDPSLQCWEITVSHASLPATELYSRLPSEPLFREPVAREVAIANALDAGLTLEELGIDKDAYWMK